MEKKEILISVQCGGFFFDIRVPPNDKIGNIAKIQIGRAHV